MLSEGVPIGNFILKIEARDADLNPKLRYYLTGYGAEHFSLDIDTGNFHTKTSTRISCLLE
jgi:protocadherin Fat 1/2/3